MTKLKRDLIRVIEPENGTPFVLTVRTDGIIMVRRYRARRAQVQRVDLRTIFDSQMRLEMGENN